MAGRALPAASRGGAPPRRAGWAGAGGGGGEAALRLLDADRKPRDILTKEAFENAIAVMVAIGGSTNAVLHLLAIAREAGVPLSLDNFDRISRRTPHIAHPRPCGRSIIG